VQGTGYHERHKGGHRRHLQVYHRRLTHHLPHATLHCSAHYLQLPSTRHDRDNAAAISPKALLWSNFPSRARANSQESGPSFSQTGFYAWYAVRRAFASSAQEGPLGIHDAGPHHQRPCPHEKHCVQCHLRRYIRVNNTICFIYTLHCGNHLSDYSLLTRTPCQRLAKERILIDYGYTTGHLLFCVLLATPPATYAIASSVCNTDDEYLLPATSVRYSLFLHPWLHKCCCSLLKI